MRKLAGSGKVALAGSGRVTRHTAHTHEMEDENEDEDKNKVGDNRDGVVETD